MIRIAASICFALTLLCPVFCLTDVGDDCAARTSLDGENCEAMSIGAVIEKTSSSSFRRIILVRQSTVS